MQKVMHRVSMKAGLPPGALVHIGERKLAETMVTLIDYAQHEISEQAVTELETLARPQDVEGVRWIDVKGLHETEVVRGVAGPFGVHPLLIEDILNTSQRPKLEDHGEYLFLVFKMLYPGGQEGEVCAEQVSLVLGRGYVITFQESGTDVFESVRERIRTSRGLIRTQGADYLAYALIDAVVDHYFPILEDLEEAIEATEGELLDNPTVDTLAAIHRLKNDTLFYRRNLWPLRDVLYVLERGDSGLIADKTRIYLRDVYDHIIQVVDTTEIYRELIAGQLELYLSTVSNRMNEVMKVLTIFASIFIPLTFIAGIYGMNFQYMPELGWRWGYPVLLGCMLTVGVAMVFFFRRRHWL